MEFEFDPDKDEVSRSKHGLSLAKTERMDFETAAIEPDRRYAYGAISLRKANVKERRRHDERA